MAVFGVFGLKGGTSEKNWAHWETKEKGKCLVWDDFNYACRKAPTSLCYGGDQTLISSVWKRVPQMFFFSFLWVGCWLLLSPGLCLSPILSVSLPSLPNYPKYKPVSGVLLGFPLLLPYLPPLLKNVWNIQAEENSWRRLSSAQFWSKDYRYRETQRNKTKQIHFVKCSDMWEFSLLAEGNRLDLFPPYCHLKQCFGLNAHVSIRICNVINTHWHHSDDRLQLSYLQWH